MNKTVFFLILLSFLFCGFNGKTQTKFSTHTHLIASFHHLGSYGKERSIIGVEQALEYHVSERLVAQIQVGINLYPAALAAPVSLGGRYTFNPDKRFPISTTHLVGPTLKLGDVFMKSNRYYGGVGVLLKKESSFRIIPEIGYTYLWDPYGPGAISFMAGIRFFYL